MDPQDNSLDVIVNNTIPIFIYSQLNHWPVRVPLNYNVHNWITAFLYLRPETFHILVNEILLDDNDYFIFTYALSNFQVMFSLKGCDTFLRISTPTNCFYFCFVNRTLHMLKFLRKFPLDSN